MRTLLSHYFEERLLARGSVADLVAAAPAQAPSAAAAALAAMGCQVTKKAKEKAKTAGLVERRSANEVRNRLESNVIAICGDVLVRDFSLDHWVEILQPIVARGCFVQANRVLSYTKVMMSWAVARRCRNDNPLTVLAKLFQDDPGHPREGSEPHRQARQGAADRPGARDRAGGPGQLALDLPVPQPQRHAALQPQHRWQRAEGDHGRAGDGALHHP
jgi:hypothetical protein